MPLDFLESILKNLNGSYGSRYHQVDKNELRHFGEWRLMYAESDLSYLATDVWYSFKFKEVPTCRGQSEPSYAWRQVASFCRHDVYRNYSLIVCLDCPEDTKQYLVDKLRLSSTRSNSVWHEIFLQVVKGMYDKSVWYLRDYIKNAEHVCNYSSPSAFTEKDRLVRLLAGCNPISSIFMSSHATLYTRTKFWT